MESARCPGDIGFAPTGTEWRYSMEYLTTAEFAEKWGISQRRVGIYCKERRLEGAMIKGKTWLIPEDAKKPEDPRKTRKKAN